MSHKTTDLTSLYAKLTRNAHNNIIKVNIEHIWVKCVYLSIVTFELFLQN